MMHIVTLGIGTLVLCFPPTGRLIRLDSVAGLLGEADPSWGSLSSTQGRIALGLRWDSSQMAEVVDVLLVTSKGIEHEQSLNHRCKSTSEAFGIAVHIEGESLAVGHARAGGVLCIGGVVQMFAHDEGKWALSQQVIPSRRSAMDMFGGCIARSADVMAIGAPGADRVFVFRQTNGVWNEEAMLVPSPELASGDFGWAIASDRARVVIGSHAADGSSKAGNVQVFRFDETKWVEHAIIKPSEGLDGTFFGCAVAIRGDRLAVAGGVDRETNCPVIEVFDISAADPLPLGRAVMPPGAGLSPLAQCRFDAEDRLVVTTGGNRMQLLLPWIGWYSQSEGDAWRLMASRTPQREAGRRLTQIGTIESRVVLHYSGVSPGGGKPEPSFLWLSE